MGDSAQTTPNPYPSNNPTQSIPPEVRQFIEALLVQTNSGPDVIIDQVIYEQKIQQIYEKLNEYLMTEIIKSMKPEDIAQMQSLVDAGKSQTEINDFINNHLMEPEKVYQRAAIQFQNIYLYGNPEGLNKPS